MPRAGNRHVVGEIKIRVPLLPAVQNSGPEARRPKSPSIFVDFFRPSRKLTSVVVQPAVVVQILNIDFEAASADRVQKFLAHFIPIFGDDLKRGWYSHVHAGDRLGNCKLAGRHRARPSPLLHTLVSEPERIFESLYGARVGGGREVLYCFPISASMFSAWRDW